MNKLSTMLLCVASWVIASEVAADEWLLIDDVSVVSESNLQALRGGEHVVDINQTLANTELDGESVGNVAMGVSSGDNHIHAGAFGSSQGVTNVIQNSGHNVLIQNATVINLSLE
ncbi:carbon storage regulator [Vibrio ulleungensis]|uniref:Carbon storage regulator n=1 Tax=Vibrio ulleungensis TaxID=2807619 RepID=A0ABS2HRD1_9VIBR|nr:carbon storage regulator [Vibrio ulleungensis]MBM7038442.1 carbon storage regulator [Vibrio ulleungensis]